MGTAALGVEVFRLTRSTMFLVLGLLVSPCAFASDFASLGVALLALFLAAANLLLGIKALAVSTRSGFKGALGYIFGATFLAFVALAFIVDESDHMADSDVSGLSIIIFAPVVIFAVLAAIFGKIATSSTDEEHT